MRDTKERTIYESRYKLVRDVANPFDCFYCGEMASSIDHVPPISRVSDYESFGLDEEVYIKVPCCRECNGLLGSSLQESVEDRIEHSKDLLAKSIKNYLAR